MGLLTVKSGELKKITIDWEELRRVADVLILAAVGFGIQAAVYLTAGKGDLEALSRAFLGF